ncbi:MAG: hypothetical protein A2143_03480 [Gallionellales bacterium RBG_16_57_15]|nr:MAG: hypothetical protein A2143_03480 [Gallionellales bacterium RBG_16_57_15]
MMSFGLAPSPSQCEGMGMKSSMNASRVRPFPFKGRGDRPFPFRGKVRMGVGSVGMGSSMNASRVRPLPFKGRVGVGMGFQCPPDRFNNRFNLIQNLIVPEPHDSKTRTFQYLIANQILRRFVMLSAIDLDNKLCFQTNKIQNGISKRMLAPEFAAFNLTSS